MLKTRVFSQNGVVKNVYHNLYWLLMSAGIIIVIYPIIVFAVKYLGDASSSFARLLNINIMLMLVVYIGMFSCITLYAMYLKSSMGYNSTRRNFFIGMFSSKVAFSVIALFSIKIIHAIIKMFLNQSYTDLIGEIQNTSMFPMILISIAACSLGEVIGITILRIGKWGMFIYVAATVILCGGMGAIFGAGFASGNFNALIGVSRLFNPQYISLVPVGVTTLLSGISWLMFRRIEIRQ